MENLAGQQIKGYELKERIAAGGFGAVYRAKQSTIGREVAIKVILPGLANKPDFIRRFEFEAQLIARLEHMNIVPLHDYWRDPDGAYLVMRYLRGGSLQDSIQKQGALTIEDAVNLFSQVAQGLHVAHRNQVIHRDIKPGNILLDEDGNGYLADFGIAKDHTTHSNITEPDSFIGSPQYLAPEQARSEAVTPQTDIYSLGVVLYEMLSGEHPFPGLERIEVIFKHLNDELPYITTLEDATSDAINAVIRKATAKDPRQRFTDVIEMMQALREAAQLDRTPTATSLVELLTPREQEVMQLIIDGKTNREIADILVLTEGTVKQYINSIYRKLKVRSRVQAIVRARELNFVVRNPVSRTSTGTGHLPEPENPYKGLQAFQASDAQHFFGRDRLTEKLLTRLQENTEYCRFLSIVGPSGSGKSSVVKAGLIPSLWRGDIPDSENWYIVDMLPGERPLDELEVALLRIASDKGLNLREQLERDSQGLLRVANLVLPDDGSELLLVIDQFEEVFTLLENESDRLHFLHLLREAVTNKRSRVRVILTLRADYYDKPLQYTDFGELIRSRAETVLPPGAEELEQMIREPAYAVGVNFEDGLVSRIVSDVHYQPGALPLLQYALTELFERRNGRILTQQAYQDIGGTGGALANRADEIFNEGTEEHQELIQQMFLRLVTLGEGAEDTRRRVDRSELLDIASNREMMEEIIDVYAGSRLLALDNDPASRRPTVEVAHEAILREWERLRSWLNYSRDDIRQERELARATADWDNHNRDTSYLLRGSRLEQVEAWQSETKLTLTPMENDFIENSLRRHRIEKQEEAERLSREEAQKERQRVLEKRNRNILGILVAVFAVATIISGGLAFVANSLRVRAENSEQNALVQASIGLASQAILELDGSFPDRAVPLALEALENYPYTWQAENALGQAVLSNRLQFTVESHNSSITYVKWSPDDNLLASADANGLVIISNGATGEEQHRFTGHEAPVLWIDWSPSDNRIVTTDIAGIVRVWDVMTGEELQILSGHQNGIPVAEWSPDESRIITGSWDTTAIIWDTASGDKVHTLEHDSPIGTLVWSPDGEQVAVADGTGRVTIWDAVTGERVLVLEGHEEWLNRIYWSSLSNRILSASDDGSATIWDAVTGDILLHLDGHEDRVWDAQWSPDETAIVTYSRDGTSRVWDGITGEERSVFSPGETGIVGSNLSSVLAFSPSGEQFAITRIGGIFTVINTEAGRVVFSHIGHAGAIIGIDWADSNRLATGSEDGTVRVWDVSPHAIQLDTPPDTLGIDWSPDGQWIATASIDGTIQVWDAETLELQMSTRTHEEGNAVVRWSPDSNRLMVNAMQPGRAIHILDSRTGELLTTFEEHSAPTHEMNWSPDGERIASTDHEGIVWVWNAISGEPILRYEGHMTAGWVVSVDWSPDGNFIASSDESGVSHIWSAENGETIQTLTPDEESWTSQVTWSPDGSMIATHSDDNTGGRIWDVADGTLINTFKGNTGTVWGLQWTSSGDDIVTTGMDGRLNIVDVSSGANLIELIFPESLSGVALSPDNRRIVFGGSVVRLIEIPWNDRESLIDYARACCVFHDLTPEERLQFGLPEQ